MSEISAPLACHLRLSTWSLARFNNPRFERSVAPVVTLVPTRVSQGEDPGGCLTGLVAICLPLSVRDTLAGQGARAQPAGEART